MSANKAEKIDVDSDDAMDIEDEPMSLIGEVEDVKTSNLKFEEDGIYYIVGMKKCDKAFTFNKVEHYGYFLDVKKKYADTETNTYLSMFSIDGILDQFDKNNYGQYLKKGKILLVLKLEGATDKTSKSNKKYKHFEHITLVAYKDGGALLGGVVDGKGITKDTKVPNLYPKSKGKK